MSRWGNLNKKSIKNILENGILYLNNKLEENQIEDKCVLWKEYNNLYNLLYNGDGRTLLCITNQVKYEKSLNKIRLKLENK